MPAAHRGAAGMLEERYKNCGEAEDWESGAGPYCPVPRKQLNSSEKHD